MSRKTLPEDLNFEANLIQAQGVDCVLGREHEDDEARLEVLWREIFGPGRLAKTAERLREHNQTIIRLNRVIRHGDRLVGAVRFWPIEIEDHSSLTQPGLLLGPFGIHRQFQGSGFGSQLMIAALAAAREDGCAFVLLVGDATYYGRFGFASLGTRMQLPGPVDSNRVLGLALQTSPGSEMPTIPSGRVLRAR